MSGVWLTYYIQKYNSYDNSLMETEADSNTFLELNLVLDIKLTKIIPKRTAWETYQSAPKNF
jgi:hypothetical protein